MVYLLSIIFIVLAKTFCVSYVCLVNQLNYGLFFGVINDVLKIENFLLNLSHASVS